MEITDWVFVSLVGVFTLVAAVMDLRTRRIPNWYTVPAFVAALIFHIATGGFSGLGTAMAGFGVGFGILFVLWLIGGGGGGDVKLMGALGAWLGATYTLFVIILSAVLAAFFSIFFVFAAVSQHGFSAVRKRHFDRPGANSSPKKKKSGDAAEEASKAKSRRRLLPYALPVACSTWAILIWQIIKSNNG